MDFINSRNSYWTPLCTLLSVPTRKFARSTCRYYQPQIIKKQQFLHRHNEVVSTGMVHNTFDKNQSIWKKLLENTCVHPQTHIHTCDTKFRLRIPNFDPMYKQLELYEFTCTANSVTLFTDNYNFECKDHMNFFLCYLVKHYAMKAYGGSRGIDPLFLTSALDAGKLSASRPCSFTLGGKSLRYPLNWRLGGPQSRSGRSGEEKNLVLLEIKPGPTIP
jgi:hypothetical protein